jgi:hypothetical protein
MKTFEVFEVDKYQLCLFQYVTIEIQNHKLQSELWTNEYPFTAMSSLGPLASGDADTSPVCPLGEFRLGTQNGPPDVLMLVDDCVFGSPDAALLASLLPQLEHVRGERRLATLVQLVGEESHEQRLARDVTLAPPRRFYSSELSAPPCERRRASCAASLAPAWPWRYDGWTKLQATPGSWQKKRPSVDRFSSSNSDPL